MDSFPVDDAALNTIEAAIAVSYDFDDDGNRVLIGGDFTLDQLLDFYSGFNPKTDLEPDDENNDYITIPLYSRHDMILALIHEIRRLRITSDN